MPPARRETHIYTSSMGWAGALPSAQKSSLCSPHSVPDRAQAVLHPLNSAFHYQTSDTHVLDLMKALIFKEQPESFGDSRRSDKGSLRKVSDHREWEFLFRRKKEIQTASLPHPGNKHWYYCNSWLFWVVMISLYSPSSLDRGNVPAPSLWLLWLCSF